jgi:two-component system sensor histidine kinase AlgZ
MPSPSRPEPPPAPAPGEANSRPPSLWPDTTREQRGDRSSMAMSHFDPLHEQQQKERERLSSQFDLCRPALALRVLMFIQVVVALAALPAASSLFDWLLRAAGLAFAALAAGLVWVPSVCALKPWLTRQRPLQRQLVVAAIGALAALLGWYSIAALALAPATTFAAGGAAAGGAALALMVWSWLTLRAAAAQPVEAGARLAELQSRIRPHFLFNALNTALALVQVDPDRAESVLEDLSQLFRVALAETGSAVTLDEEIDLAQRYLAIEKLRFGDRMQVVWDLDPAAGSARVPPLVLQPLVENAVRHGVEPARGGGRIQVRTHVRRGMVELVVTNTLPEEPGRKGSGIALANVRERLRLLHDVAARFETGVVDGLFRARMDIPL